jgi:hypothetical protein
MTTGDNRTQSGTLLPVTKRAASGPAAGDPRPTRLIDALTELRGALAAISYPLSTPGAATAGEVSGKLLRQLDDYLLPRLARLDAPLLVVVGGSTGAGKSTLVNSLVQAPVSPAGVLRPTTRSPVLVCHPSDARWFTERHLLPGLPRTSGLQSEPGSLRVITAPGLSPGLALLDAPDIDSVVEANREFAEQLLAAADLWLFLTTAARYADAVPWSVLQTARSRGTALALVLDRVPAGAEDEVGAHLGEMLTAEGLASAHLFVLPEVVLDGPGLLADRLVKPLRDWLSGLAQDATARAAVVRQTVTGAVAALGPAVEGLAIAADEQAAAARTLREDVEAAYQAALSTVEDGSADGTLLRGEVLARWQEFVGTGELMRALQARVGRLRDRVGAAVTGKTPPGKGFQDALSAGLATLIRAAVADARERARGAWQAQPAGRPLLETMKPGGDKTVQPGGDLETMEPGGDLTEQAQRLVRDWQRGVLELVRAEGASRRRVARVAAYTVNATGLLVMIAVFASTAFIPTGAEIVVAGGTSAAGQALLSAVFGDQAMRKLAEQSRGDLIRRVRELLDADAAGFIATLDAAGAPDDAAARLRAACAEVKLREKT